MTVTVASKLLLGTNGAHPDSVVVMLERAVAHHRDGCGQPTGMVIMP